MSLTTNGKNYIAQKFGTSNCFVLTGLTWTAVASDGTQVTENGGTASIIGRLVTTSVYASIIINNVTYTYAQMKTANDNTDMTLTDAQWIAANDGSPAGEAQYCFTCTPNWKCETPLNGYKSDGCGNRILDPTCNPITTGSINFTSSPSGANITLDGNNTGKVTDTTIQNVTTGTHLYVLTKNGYKDKSGQTTVTANATSNVSETLELLTTNEKITLNDSFTNYNCYGFTIPLETFECSQETKKVYAIYSTGDCNSIPSTNFFIWYRWNIISLSWEQFIQTPPLSTTNGFCNTEASLPCGYMYKAMYATTEKIFTIQKQIIGGMSLASVATIALIGLGIVISAIKK